MDENVRAPREIVWATRLLWLDAFVGVIDYGRIFANDGDAITLGGSVVVILAIVGSINYFLLKAKGWVRWVMVVLTAISLFALLDPGTRASVVALAFFGITTLIEVVAIYLVFCTPAKPWFKHS